MRIRHINTDLEIESRSDLSPLIKWFEDEGIGSLGSYKSRGVYYAAFEFVVEVGDPESLIEQFCMYISSLDGELKTLWEGCCKKVFDIGFGYEESDKPVKLETTVTEKTISRVAGLGASIAITIYPSE